MAIQLIDALHADGSLAMEADKLRLAPALQNAIAAAALSGSEIWMPPAVVHPRNIEFDSLTLPADTKWASGSPMTPIVPANTALNPFTPPVTVPAYQLHTQRRRSWLSWQTPQDSTIRTLYWPWAAPANASVMARLLTSSCSQGIGTPATSFLWENTVRFCLFANNGGVPDVNNYIYIQIGAGPPPWIGPNNNLSLYAMWGYWQGGAETTSWETPGEFMGITTVMPLFELLGFRKTGTSYGMYVGNGETFYDLNSSASQGNPQAITFTPTIAYVGIRFCANGGRTRPYFRADFLRFADDQHMVPW